MAGELETDRLVLRPPLLADAPTLFAFLGDRDAMRFTRARASLRDCRRYLAGHERQRARVGCAPWVVIAKADNAIVGFGGLYDDPFDPGWGVEVGYFFAPDAWGWGYATELARACLDLATRERRWTEISAFAHPENVGSQRVLEKTGFQRSRFISEMNRHLYTWRLPS